MHPRIDVITPTVSWRKGMLEDAVASVKYQTIPVHRHIIAEDFNGRPDACRNELVQKSDAEWIAFLDDDDIFYPRHLELLYKVAQEENASMVYSRCDYPPGMGADRFPIDRFDEGVLRAANYIPITVLMRKQAFIDVGMFPIPVQFHGYEDWFLWLALMDHGHKIAFCPDTTWLYRLHGHSWKPEWFIALTNGGGDK